MSKLVFPVEEAPEGGYLARALGECIFTKAEDWDTLKRNVIDAVDCHYAGCPGAPKVIRLHWVKDEVLAL